jgi:hypothetical protein
MGYIHIRKIMLAQIGRRRSKSIAFMNDALKMQNSQNFIIQDYVMRNVGTHKLYQNGTNMKFI